MAIACWLEKLLLSAQLGCAVAAPPLVRGGEGADRPAAVVLLVLVGGLGMGFTLKATLDLLPPDAIVTVAELVPAVVQWNRGPLASLADHPLSDRRVRIEVTDVGFTLRANPGQFDAILLDVDNGPDGIVRDANFRIYTKTGLGKARDALRPGGILAVWSAAPDHKFTQRLKDSGFSVEVREVRARPNNKGPRHTIWFARKR